LLFMMELETTQMKRGEPVRKEALMRSLGQIEGRISRNLMCFILLAGVCFGHAVAEEAVAGTNADEPYGSPEHNFVLADEIDSSPLEEHMKAYLAEREWHLGSSPLNPGNAYIGWAEAPIQADPSDVRFGQARVAAYERAIAIARGEFVQERGIRVTDRIYSRFFEDTLPDTPQSEESLQDRALVIAEKMLDLGEAQLNEFLREAGIDPSAYRGAERTQRKTIMQNAISRTTATEAISSVAGLRVLHTFENLNGVGVLVVYSNRLEDTARLLHSGRIAVTTPDEPLADTINDQIDAMLGGEEDALIYVHGVRDMTDITGHTALVSFGQWSPTITNQTGRMQREHAIRSAREQARNRAFGALAQFVKGMTTHQSRSEFMENAQVEELVYGGRIDVMESYDIGSLVDTVIDQTARANMDGVTTIRQWAANHPETGHLVLGHILLWSPATQQAARGELQDAGAATDQPAGDRGHTNRVRQSPDFGL